MWCACTTWAGRVLNVRWTCAELVVVSYYVYDVVCVHDEDEG